MPDGAFVSLGERFRAREGHWIGAKVGIYSMTPNQGGASGRADFDYFHFRGWGAPADEKMD
jgi:hypothetical protein